MQYTKSERLRLDQAFLRLDMKPIIYQYLSPSRYKPMTSIGETNFT
jgi:hypothetical protein